MYNYEKTFYIGCVIRINELFFCWEEYNGNIKNEGEGKGRFNTRTNAGNDSIGIVSA
jgi:hypothetical protein